MGYASAFAKNLGASIRVLALNISETFKDITVRMVRMQSHNEFGCLFSVGDGDILRQLYNEKNLVLPRM